MQKYVYKYSLLSYICLFNDNRTFPWEWNEHSKQLKSAARFHTVPQLVWGFCLKGEKKKKLVYFNLVSWNGVCGIIITNTFGLPPISDTDRVPKTPRI